jgi:hypothetical protein
MRQRILLLATWVFVLATGSLSARTIVVTDEDCERMAMISPEFPRQSWVLASVGPGVTTTQSTLPLYKDRAFLICLPIDKIPKGQRITKAELVVPVYQLEGNQRVNIRRIVKDWGVGVCNDFRAQRPKKEEWSKPGARDTTADARPTALLKIHEGGEQSVNVTEDVELWYTGAASNHGWLLFAEFDQPAVHLYSPLSGYPVGRGKWKLRITYEPE